jgi:hypothetical protein
MIRRKVVVVLLAMLILGLCASTWGCTTQGPQEQKVPPESQKMPGEQEITEETMEDPAKMMEETANEEQKSPQ